jgi:hypothetical protein
MSILRTLANDFQTLFPATDKGQERFRWFVLTLQAILVPITASRTSNLLRAIETLFGAALCSKRTFRKISHLGPRGSRNEPPPMASWY